MFYCLKCDANILFFAEKVNALALFFFLDDKTIRMVASF